MNMSPSITALICITLLSQTVTGQRLSNRDTRETTQLLKRTVVKSVTHWEYKYKFGQPSETGTKLEVLTYDTLGNLCTKTSFRSSGKPSFSDTCRYDDLQRLLEVITYDETRTPRLILGKETYKYVDGKVDFIQYDKDGRVGQKKTFACDSLGYVVDEDLSKCESKRDKDGTVLESAYPSLANPRHKITYKYDPARRLVELRRARFDISGYDTPTAETIYRYNQAGNQIEVEYLGGRYPTITKESLKYNNDGLKLEILKYDGNGEPTELHKYTYEFFSRQ